ncbi:MAG: PilN domain-containing protein [Acidobacteria bacterium]|nr:PilN domain-containing protein [Acidobacteriota bacterium]MBV9145398.1 PilN domain-containing protein [Acidobacteriota bacterium]
MIRINLSGKPKQKSKRGGAGAVAPEFESTGSPNSANVLVAIVVLAASFGGIWWYQNQLNADAANIKTRMDAAQRESQSLAQTKLRFEQRQKIKDEYEARVKVIDSLRSSQAGPVELLTMVSSTVNNTDEVWLNAMSDGGANVNVDGTALSTNAVANLMTNLMKTGYFKSVEIKETYQDEQEKKIQAFNFTLTCEKQAAPAAVAPAGSPSAKKS